MIINKVLYNYGYSAFNLSILEYIDITNLSKNEAKIIILEREQYYLDTLSPSLWDGPLTAPDYYILKIAGSLLGFKHFEESLAIMNLNNKGKVLNEELKALLSEIKKGVPLTDEHKSLISQAKKGVLLTDAHKTALSKARENIVFSDTHKMNMSIANGTQINVFSSDRATLLNTFSSSRKAALHFNVSKDIIIKYARSG
jgi:group I intron endonuclease